MTDRSGNCNLCGAEAEIKLSHIVPAFAFRWLRDTSGTGHIRNSKIPNLRVQDGIKIQLLCNSCEGVLSTWETPFSREIFHRWNDNQTVKLNYGDWMLKFCTSVSWRILQLAEREGFVKELPPQHALNLEKASSTWARFMLGELPHPGRFEQHLLPLSAIQDHNLNRMPQNMNRYLLRAIDIDIVHGSFAAFTYAKIGPFVIFGMFGETKIRWQGTKVHVREGSVKPNEFVLPKELLEHLMSRAGKIQESFNNTSEVQQNKIERQALSNIDRFVSSKQFEAMLEDCRLFGRSALLTKPKT